MYILRATGVYKVRFYSKNLLLIYPMTSLNTGQRNSTLIYDLYYLTLHTLVFLNTSISIKMSRKTIHRTTYLFIIQCKLQRDQHQYARCMAGLSRAASHAAIDS
ncbi:hypothetical protein BO78DRAFT_32710 [Aspergillus sclerotiicarbonarius CBS 121057]|uniref:Uncharacterized protein n=1 Tax=Aspergillus sclerotiicarbonarius (strain CBS 121057 / IBT 28362) TaxID=1448318 RepID=A0A319EHB0_ASPSB|nr:hypothetical protein BO78DRAFT_32710 [Aspergillus sclerotiicarbonarius CBS 121057]